MVAIEQYDPREPMDPELFRSCVKVFSQVMGGTITYIRQPEDATSFIMSIVRDSEQYDPSDPDFVATVDGYLAVQRLIASRGEDANLIAVMMRLDLLRVMDRSPRFQSYFHSTELTDCVIDALAGMPLDEKAVNEVGTNSETFFDQIEPRILNSVDFGITTIQ